MEWKLFKDEKPPGGICPECKSEMKNKLQESWYGDTIVHFECNCGKKIILIDLNPRCNYSVKREMRFDKYIICQEKTLLDQND